MKKWIPTRRLGSFRLLAQGLDLDARGIGGEDGARLELGLELGVQGAFGIGIFKDGLDDHIGIGDALAIHVHAQASERGGRRGGVLETLLEEDLGALHRRLDQFRGAILQGNRHAAQRRPRGDIAAHDTGADDMHVAKLSRGFSSQALQPILQHEYAHQIARGGTAHQIADGSCLRLIALRAGGAMALPQIENGVGRRILIAPHAVPQLRGRLPRDEGACRSQVQESVDEGRPCLRRRSEQPRLGALEKRRRRHELVDQTHGQRPRSLVRLALEHEIERGAHTDEPDAAYRTAEPRMNAEQYLGQSQGQLGIVRSHPVGAGERKFQAAPQCEAVQGGNAGAGQILERLQHGLSGTHQLIALLGGAYLQKFLDVGAGDEAARLGGANHHAGRRLCGDFLKLQGQIAQHRRGQDIGRGSGRIAHQPGNAVGVDFQAPRFGVSHQAAC